MNIIKNYDKLYSSMYTHTHTFKLSHYINNMKQYANTFTTHCNNNGTAANEHCIQLMAISDNFAFIYLLSHHIGLP